MYFTGHFVVVQSCLCLIFATLCVRSKKVGILVLLSSSRLDALCILNETLLLNGIPSPLPYPLIFVIIATAILFSQIDF